MVTDDTQLLDVDPFRSITVADPDQVLHHAVSGQSIMFRKSLFLKSEKVIFADSENQGRAPGRME